MDFDEMPLQSELALPMASNFLVEIDVSHCKVSIPYTEDSLHLKTNILHPETRIINPDF
jgi:hypothetical protein